ncbi:MAG: hypothetical protein WBE38_05670, partial [Terracidiphilus sp.]
SIFGIHVDFLRAVKGGFFLMKKPLVCVLSVYTNSENAIARLSHFGHLLKLKAEESTHQAKLVQAVPQVKSASRQRPPASVAGVLLHSEACSRGGPSGP